MHPLHRRSCGNNMVLRVLLRCLCQQTRLRMNHSTAVLPPLRWICTRVTRRISLLQHKPLCTGFSGAAIAIKRLVSCLRISLLHRNYRPHFFYLRKATRGAATLCKRLTALMPHLAVARCILLQRVCSGNGQCAGGICPRAIQRTGMRYRLSGDNGIVVDNKQKCGIIYPCH